MKITFDLDQKDFWNFTKYSIMHIPYVRLRFINTSIGVPFLVLLFGLYSDYGIFKLISHTFGMTIFSVLITVYLTKRNIKKITRIHPGLLGEHTVEITPSGLRECTKANDTTQPWDTIANIAIDKNYIYLLSGINVFGIPKKAFSSEAESEQFFQMALGYWKEPKGK